MDERFDDLSRGMADSMPRRGVLKMVGAAVAAAAAATVLKPFRGDAITTSCPAGTSLCGNTCCKGTCSQAATSCCCDAGQTPCGPGCCAKGVACLNQTTGLCGCPAGTTPCGSGVNTTCCPAGAACSSGCPTPQTFGPKSKTKTCCAAQGESCDAIPCCPGRGLVCVGGGDGGCMSGATCQVI
ncbi:MAG: hypothetical protein JWP02_3258 [Acidimicrobiales bacterium]|nr:hypothetical protein [Acidimicrobiales bacterium]